MPVLARALVGVGLAVVVSTEVLSAFEMLRPASVAIFWIITIAASAMWLRPRWQSWLWWEWLLLAGVAGILGVIGFTALRAAPNSADAMAYHLPRVVYWKQMGSVRFFPTSYLNQIMLPPLAEYFMLHTWLLSGGDHFVNLVQWFGCAGSAMVAWQLARELGATRMGQWLAVVFAVTLPNGILQASGAKNDYLETLWLMSAVLFTLRRDWWFLGIAAGLALLTKSTAYLFLPVAVLPWLGRAPMKAFAIAGLVALGINAPQYWRNFELSGSVLGYDSAHADGKYRWRNERFGFSTTFSNLARHASQQFGGRSDAWNQRVYAGVDALHRRLGLDLNDPSTTWPGTRFAAPRNSNHEADAHNRWHLLLAIASVAAALILRQWRVVAYLLSLFGGFVLFAGYLKWQPFMQRLLLPLFVLAAPAVGVPIGRFRWPALAMCLFLLNASRPYLFENWTRPLRGEQSILRTTRLEQYFNDTVQFGVKPNYLAIIDEAKSKPCRTFAIDMSRFELEYPFQAAMLAADPSSQFVHTAVHNASSRYRPPSQQEPCAVICLACGDGGLFTYRQTVQ